MSAARPRISRRAAPLAYGFLTVVTLLALTPTAWVMVSSLKTGTQVFTGAGVLPDPVTLQGYVDAFTQIELHHYVLNTLLYATLGSAGAIAAAFLAAYPLARYAFRGRSTLVAGFSLALAIPVVGLATPEFFIMRELGLFDSRAGMVIFYAALQFPFTFVVLRSYLLSTPRELEEAAAMDGAGYFTTMVRVVLPLTRPALATVAVVSFVQIWNEFFFANLFLVSQEHQNVQLALAGFRSQFGFNVTGAIAGATIVMLVPIIVFVALQRQVIAGLTAGAVK
ncbi:carbohydrate ABC transporter permease [Jiangella aurantiaca]|uniref:Carbohydrate ABC transporter permease n=1 Tax=Jiangella aurantiaca TaxID=2530373 RepID=A0A4R5A6C2_9ACTN|nr:carbohydrate ABC transporter permease [Jiangella aurantiaca]TDD67628.1 carbohydrate ABC transporter permease [Jiangella aurantiaca]